MTSPREPRPRQPGRGIISPPSKNTLTYWFGALNRKTDLTELELKRSGKFLIFEPRQYIDESWKRIGIATQAGKLGFSAKVSTRKRKSKTIGFSKTEAVICVYAKDSNDEEEKERIRENLYRLGYTEHLPYKTDEDTLNGVYSKKYCGGSGTRAENSSNDADIGERTPSSSKRNVSNKPDVNNVDPDSQSGQLKQNRHSDQMSPNPVDKNIAKTDLVINNPMPLIRKRNIYPQPRDWKPIKYIHLYTTSSFPYSTKRYVHIRQIYPTLTDSTGKTVDIIFPLEEFKEVTDSLYKLGRTFLEEEDKIIYGLKTLYIEMSVRFSKEFENICICFHSKKNHVNVFIPQTSFRFIFKQMESMRKLECYGDPDYADHGISTDEDDIDSETESDGSKVDKSMTVCRFPD